MRGAILAPAALLAVGTACMPPGPEGGGEALRVVVDGADEACTTLYAGQHIDVGEVCVSASSDELFVTYRTTGGWELVQAHLWVGQDLDDAPTTPGGNPIPGQFPYHSGDLAGVTEYTFAVPLEDHFDPVECDETTLFVAAHAAVRNGDQAETAWGFGPRFVERGNWGTYLSVVLSCADDPVEECHTAYAWSPVGSHCFTDDGFATVGWTHGPLAFGRVFRLVVPGSACDPTSPTGGGMEVGRVYLTVSSLDIEDPEWTATVRTHSDPLEGVAPADALVLEATWAYLDGTPYPAGPGGADTIDPAAFTSVHTGLAGVTSDVHTLFHDILAHAIVQAEVCGDFSYATEP